MEEQTLSAEVGRKPITQWITTGNLLLWWKIESWYPFSILVEPSEICSLRNMLWEVTSQKFFKRDIFCSYSFTLYDILKFYLILLFKNPLYRPELNRPSWKWNIAMPSWSKNNQMIFLVAYKMPLMYSLFQIQVLEYLPEYLNRFCLLIIYFLTIKNCWCFCLKFPLFRIIYHVYLSSSEIPPSL